MLANLRRFASYYLSLRYLPINFNFVLPAICKSKQEPTKMFKYRIQLKQIMLGGLRDKINRVNKNRFHKIEDEYT